MHKIQGKRRDKIRDAMHKTQSKDKSIGETKHMMEQMTKYRLAAITSLNFLNLLAFTIDR